MDFFVQSLKWTFKIMIVRWSRKGLDDKINKVVHCFFLFFSKFKKIKFLRQTFYYDFGITNVLN